MANFGKFAGYMAQNLPGAMMADIDAREQKRRFDQMEANMDRRRKEDKIYQEALQQKEWAWRDTQRKETEKFRRWEISESLSNTLLAQEQADQFATERMKQQANIQKGLIEHQQQVAIDMAPKIAEATSKAEHAKRVSDTVLMVTEMYNRTPEDQRGGVSLDQAINDVLLSTLKAAGAQTLTIDQLQKEVELADKSWQKIKDIGGKEFDTMVADADGDEMMARAKYIGDSVGKSTEIYSSFMGSNAGEKLKGVFDKATLNQKLTEVERLGYTDASYKMYLETIKADDSPEAVEKYNAYMKANKVPGGPYVKQGPVESVLDKGGESFMGYPSLEFPFEEPMGRGINIEPAQPGGYMSKLAGKKHLR